MADDNFPIKGIEQLYGRISALIEQSRHVVARTIKTAEVYAKYEIGRYIVEEEQGGELRATYGKALLSNLSQMLTLNYGAGWSVETLTACRKFFNVYSNSVNSVHEIENNHPCNSLDVRSNSSEPFDSQINTKPEFILSWSHYLVLMRVENPDARRFYEIECAQQDWSVRQLKRQVGSSLYERLALSRDKEEVMRLASEGQTVEKPSDIIKNPVTLEFLGLKPDESYSESKLENAIINKMQQFLLELGKGFLFEARQKRFTFDERNFYVDLVFYNRLLQCYVLIDLKTGDLSHQDLGQMQMYVNYYDRHVKQDFETPTIGILLCEEKSDALVKLTLPENANIYASQYQLYLPDKKLLKSKLQEWINEFNEQN
ncbi:MAG: DUF1016 family protein [Muribaculaceae bacterium]|nr:DUF1016 family protein [Muribaculaceae bacterium]